MVVSPKTIISTISVNLAIEAVDSTYELLTQSASNYREQNIYPIFTSKGYELVLLSGALARQSYAAAAAVKPGVAFLTGVSHGTYTTFTGDFNEPVFAVGGYSENEVQNKIVHFLSCGTAKILGPDFVANGCQAFIGYDENFIFDPPSANTFFECDGQIDIGLADGLTVAEAVGSAKALFNQRIQEFQAAGNHVAAGALEFNLAHLRSPLDGSQWGSPGAKLS